MESLSVIASYAALLLSVILAVVAGVRTSRDKTETRITHIEQELSEAKSYRERQRGADLPQRLQSVETRQRADETALVRVEERMANIDRSLAVLCDELREHSRQS
jgi:septal ring factor EnvC (AmiA/AmiB activator)